MNKTKKKLLLKDSKLKPNDSSEIILYTTKDGKIKLDTIFQDETIWLTQAKMAKLFDIERSVITKHLGNIYKTNELEKELTRAKIAQVQTEGNRKVSRKIAKDCDKSDNKTRKVVVFKGEL